MALNNVLSWMSTYQLKTVVIGLAIVALCVGGYLLMDKSKKENDGFVIMKRNAKGQFQKAIPNENIAISEEKKEETFTSQLKEAEVHTEEVQPETVIRKSIPVPEREIRRDSGIKPEYGRPLNRDKHSAFTNADKIRAMSDDELADFLMNVQAGGFIKLWLKSKESKDSDLI